MQTQIDVRSPRGDLSCRVYAYAMHRTDLIETEVLQGKQ